MNGGELYLRKEDSCTHMLVVPTECVVVLSGSESLPIDLDIFEESRVPCGLKKPCSSPQQLVLTPFH